MNVPEGFFDADGDECTPVQHLRANSAISDLLAGLERQRKELGPIADELISLLHRLGVREIPRDVAATPLPKPSWKANPSSESSPHRIQNTESVLPHPSNGRSHK